MSRSIDPGWKRLLGPILEEPDSRLAWALTRRGPVSTTGRKGLRARAERHLLREQREEVAYRLYRAAENAILSLPRSRSLCHRVTRDSTQRNRRAYEYEHRDRSPGEIPNDPRARRALDEHAHVLSEAPGSVVASALAAASLDLDPRDETRIVLAVSHDLEEHSDSAESEFSSILERPLNSLNRSIAEQALATLYLTIERLDEALAAYKRAALVCPERPDPLLGWMHSAIRCEAVDEALEASARTSGVDSANLALVLQEHVQIWTDARSTGRVVFSRQATRCALKVLERLPTSCAEAARIFVEREG